MKLIEKPQINLASFGFIMFGSMIIIVTGIEQQEVIHGLGET